MKTVGANRLRRAGMIAAVIVCVICLVLWAFDVRLRTVTYTLPTGKAAAPVRVVFLADLHSCLYGQGQQTLVDAIDAQKPDIILLGGDICDDRSQHRNTELLLRAVANRYPCYYVTGNHEYWSGEADVIIGLFRTCGVKVLEGEYETITVNGQPVNICGVDDPDVDAYTQGGIPYSRQLEALDGVSGNGYFTILLAHRPERIGSYLGYGFDLVLSGHAHGGQWRIPGILNGLYAPDQGWFPRYAGGRYSFDGCEMIVSRGLARESTRIPRIFNRPELVVVDIVPSQIE